MKRTASAIGIGLAWGAFASGVGADIPAPPDYSAECNIEKQQEEGTECVSCPTRVSEPDKCKDEYGAAGYTYKCRTSDPALGADEWSEIWCRPLPETQRADASLDSSVDSSADPGPDSRVDSTPDSSADPGPDSRVGVDSTPDSRVDSTPDSRVDSALQAIDVGDHPDGTVTVNDEAIAREQDQPEQQPSGSGETGPEQQGASELTSSAAQEPDGTTGADADTESSSHNQGGGLCSISPVQGGSHGPGWDFLLLLSSLAFLRGRRYKSYELRAG